MSSSVTIGFITASRARKSSESASVRLTRLACARAIPAHTHTHVHIHTLETPMSVVVGKRVGPDSYEEDEEPASQARRLVKEVVKETTRFSEYPPDPPPPEAAPAPKPAPEAGPVPPNLKQRSKVEMDMTSHLMCRTEVKLVLLSSLLFAPLFVILPVILHANILMLTAAASTVPAVVATLRPGSILLLFRARVLRGHDYDYAIDFLQAWGLFSAALGIVSRVSTSPPPRVLLTTHCSNLAACQVCAVTASCRDVETRAHVSYAIVILTALSVLWDLKLATSPHYGPFGFFAAAMNFWIAAGHIVCAALGGCGLT